VGEGRVPLLTAASDCQCTHFHKEFSDGEVIVE
jgi:hypothetical protein